MAGTSLAPMRAELTRYAPRMKEVVGARGASEYVNRQIGLAMLVMRDNTALAACSPESIAQSMIRACGLRLEIGRTAHLVPFKGKCTLVIAWQGLVELMVRAGHVRDVRPRVVYASDTFEYAEGTHPHLTHVPAAGDRGAMTHVYAIAHLRYGHTTFEVMTKDEVEAIRKASPSANSSQSPWNDPKRYDEMAKKTVVRRIAKRLPQSSDMQHALAADEVEGTFEEMPATGRDGIQGLITAGGDGYEQTAAPARGGEAARVVAAGVTPEQVAAGARHASTPDPYGHDDETVVEAEDAHGNELGLNDERPTPRRRTAQAEGR